MSIELSSQGEDAARSGGFDLSATALLHTICNLSDGIMIVGREGRIVMANPACERIFGYGSGQLRMRLFSELIQSDLANEPDSLVEWLAAGGSCGIAGVTHELQGRRANGELFLAAVTVGYVDNNGWLYFSVAVRNNTAQRKYEKELIEGKKEAERATQAKALFLANMSHEIRTPMNGILGMLQLLEETPLDDTQRDYVDVAKSSAENLLHIVNDILDISKAESGKLQFEHIEFNLAELVKHTIALMAKAADDKGLKLISLVGAEIPAKLLGDPTRLRQILLNLVGNAIKFTSQGEITVAVALANGSKQGAELFNNSLLQPGTLACLDTAILRFDVVDKGIGVSAEILPNLFQNFQQADVSTTR